MSDRDNQDNPIIGGGGGNAPDPGDPGGMGGAKVSSRNREHRPPGGVSPVGEKDSSESRG